MSTTLLEQPKTRPSGSAQAHSPEIVLVADEVLAAVGARAVTMLTTPKHLDDGRVLPPRLSANDCYVALPEACRKVARVVIARRKRLGSVGSGLPLNELFPDAAAYLARAIRSVVSDTGRAERREPVTISLETPLGAVASEGSLAIADTLADEDPSRLPEESLVDSSERAEFRAALEKALGAVPANYIAAIERDIRRERERQAGRDVAPATEAERQTLCRARAAVARVLKSECTADNPFVWLLSRQGKSGLRASGRGSGTTVAKKAKNTTAWTGERQDALVRRLLDIGWAERQAGHADGAVAEAIVNDVTAPSPLAPPSPEVRKAMRVLDLYTVDRKQPDTGAARALYNEAREMRAAGRLEDALRKYRACYEAEPSFIEALNEVGVMYSQLGRLRDALNVYLTIIDSNAPAPHRHIAATNAADIYLTWFDAGRNRDKNIELARHYAEMAMERPSPMRACNLILAHVKDRYYLEAKAVLERVIREDRPECRAQRFLETLFQIRDPDLITWWTWLEETLGKG
ncbi:MAG: tetratricopeptide repeat protein [Chthonomonadales bacterium]|nr:tetratricopeptide repeat protein [Chthonomonadales bacterium]